MKPRRMIYGLLVLATLVLAAGAEADKKEKVYKSPQAVFDAAKAAVKKDDYKTFYGCLTPDSQKLLAGQMVMGSLILKARAEEDTTGKFKEMLKPLEDLLEKHGVTKEALKKVKQDKDTGKAARALGELVKDRPAYIEAMMKLRDKNAPPGAKGKNKPLQDAELKDVKIDGDKAKGSLVRKKEDEEKKDPIEFARIAGSWKIVAPEPPAIPKGRPKESKD